jgi:poly-gamma-glutamate synthesis protein (capsule biosynthesis protein)
MNFGSTGLEMTRRYIGSAGMQYYGDPNNATEISTVITKNGIRVGFVGFHEFTYYNFDKVFAEMARLRPEVDILIVSPHWGVEYQKEPTEKMIQWAHEFIDLGADTVIGAHPHVVGQTEEYKGKEIFYSLGNFAFDQYFSEETMNGLGVIIEVEKNKEKFDLKYKEVPIRVGREGPKT